MTNRETHLQRTAVLHPHGPFTDTGSADDRTEIRTSALARWARDWERARSQPGGACALARWRSRHPCLAGLGSLEEVLAACGRDLAVPQEVADARLAAVVCEARGGDRVATRLVLQRVLPALVARAAARARSYRRPLGEILEELLASAWVVIGEYPLERRPVKIAVNIIRDAESGCYGYVPVAVRRSVLVPPERFPDRPSRADGSPLDEPRHVQVQLCEVLDEALRYGFPRDDARLLAELFLAGTPVVELAVRAGVSDRTIRNRRRAALERLSHWMGDSHPAPTRPRRSSRRGDRS